MHNPRKHPQWDQLPPEIQQMLIKQADMEDMEEHESDARIDAFLDSLNADQAVTFRDLMSTVAHVHANSYADYLCGRATSIMVYKHGRCGTCGQKHDVMVPGLAAEEVPVGAPVDAQSVFAAAGEVASVTELMERFEVTTNIGRKVKCVATAGCNKIWESLDDRMLRPPGVAGCDYCQHTAAHG